MGRQPGCDKAKLKKGPWDKEEDEKLKNCILKNGIKCWPDVAKLSGLQRCAKSCRLRWVNYLNPDIKRGNFSEDEEQTIIRLRSVLGNRWSTIASYLPGRTDNEIKNYWHTHLKKKAHELGIEHPNTHIPIQLAPSNSMVQKDTIPHVNHPNTHIPIQLALSNSMVQKDTMPHVNHPNTHIAIRLSNPVVQKDTIPKCEVIEVISDNEGGKTDGQRNKANTSMSSVTSFILENYQAICDRLDLGMWLCQDNRTKSVDGSS